MATNWDELRFGMPLNIWLMIDGRAQKHIRDLYERVEVCHAIIAQQETASATLREALEPFASAAKDCGVVDDIRSCVVRPEQSVWESSVAASLTFAQFAKALSALENSPASLADATNNPVPLTLSDAGSDAEGRDDE